MAWWKDNGEPLRDAARRNDLAALVALLDGPDPPHIDCTDTSTGQTALMEATMRGYASMAEVLLVRGAHVNFQAVRGQTALWFAVLSGQEYLVELLLSRGADANLMTTNGMTALMLAAQSHQTRIVALLIAGGADVSIAGPDGRTAEDLASIPAIKELLRVSEQPGRS
jgi:ankyrin repeat protein